MSVPGQSSVTFEGITSTSNHATEEQIRESIGAPDRKATAADAAAQEAQLEAAGSKDFVDRAGDALADLDAKEPDAASEAGKALAKKRNSLQARIDQAVAKQREAERRAAEAEARLAERERVASDPAQPKADPKATEPLTRAKPREDEVGTKYETYADYIEDLTDWKTDEKFARQQQASAASAAQRAEHDAFAKHNERLEGFKARTPDFDAVIANPDIRISRPMVDAILHSEHGPAMQYFLGQHPADAARIAGLPPGLALYEMGKIEARVSAATNGPAPVPPSVTKAKPPIKPLGSGPVAAESGPPGDDASPEAHIAYWNEQDKKARRR